MLAAHQIGEPRQQKPGRDVEAQMRRQVDPPPQRQLVIGQK
jgi:hypothetical protein